jgi:hypothetical protein
MKLKTILYATAAMMIAACSNEVNDEKDALQALTIQADIASQTRVANNAFEKDDAIGIHVVSTATNGLTAGSNVQYTAKDANGNFESSDPIYFKDQNAVNIYAYYPYAASLTDNAISVARTDQTDYLYAKKENVAYNATKQQLTFDHVMAQFTLTVKAGTGVTSLDNLTSVTLKGLNSVGSFNTLTGALTSSTAADYALAATDFTATTAASTTRAEAETSTSVTSKYVTRLLFPTSGKTEIPVDVVFDGATYSATITVAGGLLAGKSYSYTLTITRTALTVDGASISQWGEGGSGAEKAEIQPEKTSGTN